MSTNGVLMVYVCARALVTKARAKARRDTKESMVEREEKVG